MVECCRALTEQEDLQHVPLSVDTFYAEVAQQAVGAGAHMVNDVSGGLMDPHMHSQVSYSESCMYLSLNTCMQGRAPPHPYAPHNAAWS